MQDWWPPEKFEYLTCSWADASLPCLLSLQPGNPRKRIASMALPKTVLVMLLAFVACFCLGKANAGNIIEGTVNIQGQKPVATTDETFICATLDWYPPEHCNFGTCSWGQASILNLDLKNVVFFNAIKAFSPLVIRIGGSLQDKVVYQTEYQKEPCVPFTFNSSALFEFNEGCLPLARWDELNAFFARSGALVVFGLNALRGKLILPNNTAVGPWDSRNSESLIRYTVKKGHKIYGWELGNELSGRGMPIGTNADRYASDTINLLNLVQQIYQGIHPKPKIIAPGGMLDPVWYRRYISLADGALDAVTQHIYNLGKGDDTKLVEKILDPSVLEAGRGVLRDLDQIVRESPRKLDSWVGESGGVMMSGRNGVSNRFLFGFWYVDQLGMASMHNTKTYCRQSLIGGYYSLLNTTTYTPNPDYYSALLWHRLMGSKVLTTDFVASNKIRAYAHCARQSKGVALVVINLDGTTTVRATTNCNITMAARHRRPPRGSRARRPYLEEKRYVGEREEYHLTGLNGDIESQTVVLNGKALEMDRSGGIPALQPVKVSSAVPIEVAPHSIVFVHMPYTTVPACSGRTAFN